MRNQNLKRRTQKGRGKLEKSPYYYITKTAYSTDGLDDFNLYSKQKMIEMLINTGLQDEVPELNKWYTAFQKATEAEVIKMIETVLDVYSQKTNEITATIYKAFVRMDLKYIIRTFINYQLNDDSTKDELIELITNTQNTIKSETTDVTTKYNAFKQFLLTIFNEKYFSINSLNFVKHFMNYSVSMYKTQKFVFAKGMPTKTIDVVLTDDELMFNEFATKYSEFKGIVEMSSKSHYDELIKYFKKIKDVYTEKFSVPAIQNALSQTENEYEMVLKKGTKLYKGVTRDKKSRLYFSGENDKTLYWFAFDPLTTFSYVITNKASTGGINDFCHGSGLGYVGEFQMNQDIKLLNLLHPNIIAHLTALIGTDETMLKVLNKILFIKDGELVRKSFYDEDIAFVKWLCAKGFNGYVSTTSATSLHPELCLCNPTDKVAPLTEDDITDASDLFYFCDDKYEDVNFITNFEDAFMN
jgi:hypothetical protein